MPKASREAAIVLDSDDEATGQHSGSGDEEAALLRLGMHADLDRGAHPAWAATCVHAFPTRSYMYCPYRMNC